MSEDNATLRAEIDELLRGVEEKEIKSRELYESAERQISAAYVAMIRSL